MLEEPILVVNEVARIGGHKFIGDKYVFLKGKELQKDLQEAIDKQSKKIVAGTPNTLPIDFSKLSEEECKKIQWFDIEGLADGFVNKYKEEYNYRSLNGEGWLATGYVYGMKQSNHFSHKKYTEEDLRRAFHAGSMYCATGNRSEDVEKIVVKLSKPKQFLVEAGRSEFHFVISKIIEEVRV